jgi:hypothetical protein
VKCAEWTSSHGVGSAAGATAHKTHASDAMPNGMERTRGMRMPESGLATRKCYHAASAAAANLAV